MPEQISKYPDVTLKVLKEAGARCGEGAKQKILTQCPREQFCALQSGEICVYGIEQIPQMTQIKTIVPTNRCGYIKIRVLFTYEVPLCVALKSMAN